MPKPEPEMSNLKLRVPRTLWKKAEGRAIQDGVPVEQVVVNALRDYLGVQEPLNMAIPYNLPKQTRRS